MLIESVRIQGEELILKSPDHMDIHRFVYNFTPGNYEIEKKRKKRSLDANAYCWKLCTEIANVLRSNKDSIYIDMLKRYGQSELVSVLSTINVAGYFKYYDEFGKGCVNGKDFTHYKVYKGSSEYDTREMAIFIDGIIQEAKALGIQTETPDEIAKMKSLWGE